MASRTRAWRWLGILALALPATPVLAQDYQALPAYAETQIVEGQSIRLDIMPEYRIVPLGAASRVDIRVRIALADLMAKTPAILDGLALRGANPDVQFTFLRVDPPLAAMDGVWITGAVRIAARDPVLRAPIVETANFTLVLRPVVTPTVVSLTADLASFDLGGGLLGVFGLEQLLRDLVEGELRRGLAGADAVFALPPALLAYGLAITGVGIYDLGGGIPGLVADATATLDAAQLVTAIIDLTTALRP